MDVASLGVQLAGMMISEGVKVGFYDNASGAKTSRVVDPVAALALSVFKFYPQHTRVAISGNAVVFQCPAWDQGVRRRFGGHGHDDLTELNGAVYAAVRWLRDLAAKEGGSPADKAEAELTRDDFVNVITLFMQEGLEAMRDSYQAKEKDEPASQIHNCPRKIVARARKWGKEMEMTPWEKWRVRDNTENPRYVATLRHWEGKVDKLKELAGLLLKLNRHHLQRQDAEAAEALRQCHDALQVLSTGLV